MTTGPAQVLINSRYDLVRVIGRGSTGTVYLAYDCQLDREVAIKVLNDKAEGNQDIISRFEKEMFITARLQHPGVVAVFEKTQTPEGMPCCVMSLAMGQTLEAYLRHLASAGDPWAEATLVDRLTLFGKILEVVSYAHSQGVVHRDLKPANIVLGEYGEVQVLDWGLARTLEPDSNNDPSEHFDDVFGTETQTLPGEGGKRDTAPLSEKRPGSSAVGEVMLEDVSQKPGFGAAETVVGGTALGSSASKGPGSEISTQPRRPASGGRPITGIEEDYQPDDVASRVPTTTHLQQTSAPSRAAAAEAPTGRQGAGPGQGSQPGATGSDARPRDGRHSAQLRRDTTSAHRRRHESAQPHSQAYSGRFRTSTNDLARSTRFGDVLGSPVYMSPEQARGEAGLADERADIYALGVILVEMLALRPPMEQREGELLLQFIDRVRVHDGFQGLRQLWPDAPRVLVAITERALAQNPLDRYRHCDQFRQELAQVLDDLSASFSELERQRLEREREGAWLPVGRWNFQQQSDSAPFSEAVSAFEGEPVGQVLHPELGGLLLGGCGMQVYPLSLGIGDDVRLTMEFSITGGAEFWLFMRGLPPVDAYAFRIGAWNGRWLAIAQTHGSSELFLPSALTMMPIGQGQMNTTFISRDRVRRRRLVVEVVGSTLRLQLDEEELSYQDPCPLLGPEHQQIGVATLDAQLIIHELTVERRRSPLMVPSYAVANELLRQQLLPQAITHYQRFLREHAEDDRLQAEAHFMLCLAFLRAGHLGQAERELHRFIMDHMSHPLSQDAIFELAKLRVGDAKHIGPGARIVLSYQETGESSRARFCMWAVHVLNEAIREDGISAAVEESLQLLKHLIQGFTDERLLLETASWLLQRPMQAFAIKLFDLQAFEDLYRFQQRVQACVRLGYTVHLPALHTPAEYIDAARQLRALRFEDELDRRLISDIFSQYSSVRDIICLSSYGSASAIIQYLAEEPDNRATFKLLEAGLLARAGSGAAAKERLEYCFSLMDKIESERTDIEIATISRLSMFALGYLPWSVAWEPLAMLNNNAELQALAAWLAESFGHRECALDAYKVLYSAIGSGFRMVAEQGLARLQLMQ